MPRVMKRLAAILLFPIAAFAQNPRVMLVMHGGAGTITRIDSTPSRRPRFALAAVLSPLWMCSMRGGLRAHGR
jgi:hypothetical protein